MGIVLLGYRGSGKTSVARLLAEEYSWPAIDTDERIVAAAGKSIRQIFSEVGQEGFRQLEAAAVREAIAADDIIVALGGGAVLCGETRSLLQTSTHDRVYLRCDAEVLHDRIHRDPLTAQSRPSLTHLGGTLAEVRQLLALREPLYRSVMTAELDVTTLLPQAVAQAIVAILK